MSLMTKTQATGGKAGHGGRSGPGARRGGPTPQVTPLAVARGGHHAPWRAHRTDLGGTAPGTAGRTLEQRVAPRMATMLSAAARRVDPAPAKRRRWPILAAGLIAAAGLSATAAYLVKPARLRGPVRAQPGRAHRVAGHRAGHGRAGRSDVNGRVHTP